ncbi:T9SS sorting signal type C domain-containing protein [Flavobacterium sp. GB2R13]|uniref:T9SS sorting signal type C domain-containing protein n=1 Tax=Flavobacterium algoris TaxID=3398733 RepID=UPI003A89ED93
MIKKLLPHFFLVLIKFPVSFQTNTRKKNRVITGDKSLKLLSLFYDNKLSLCVYKVVFFSAFLFSFSIANAATRTSTATGGLWSSGTTWVGGIAPVAGDNATIVAGATVTVSASASITNLSLNAATSKLVISSGQTLTVSGTFTNVGTGTNGVNGPGTILFKGTASFGVLTATGTPPNVTIGDGVSVNTVTLGATNVIVANLITNVGATLAVGVRNPFTITGSFSNSGTLTGTSSRLILTGNFTNTGSFALTTGRLTISSGNFSNTGTFTLTTGRLSLISGNLVNSGTVKFSTGILTITSGSLTNNLTGSINYSTASAAANLLLGGDFNNSGAVSLGLPYVQFTGGANQTIQTFTTTGTVSMLKTGGIATFSGNVSGGALLINGTGGTLNLGTGLVHTLAGAVALTAGTLNGGSSTLNLKLVGATLSGTGTLFIPGTSTVNFAAAGAQTIAAANLTFNNVTISGSGLRTFATTPAVNGKLSLEGTTASPVVITSGVVTYGLGATLQYNMTVANSVTSEEWITPFPGSGGVIITNSGIITVNAAKVFSANVPLTINSGATLANGGFGISGSLGSLSVANGGTLNLSGTSSFPVGFTPTLNAGSTVLYSGTAQTVAVQNYGNLILNGSGNKTFAGATTIAGGVTIGGTAIAILPNTTTSSAQTLTFGGTLQTSGLWGGTGSSASFKNAVFGGATTGILNVNTSCIAGTWLGVFGTDWNTSGNWCGGILPISTTDVTIISSAPSQPVIGLAGGVCKSMTIGVGASLIIMGSNTLTVSGDWNNSGTFTANTSTVNYNGIVAQSIGGSSINTFYNLTNSNTSFIVTAGAAITVNNTLNISTNSIINMGTFALIGGGTFSNSGSGQLRTANSSVSPIPSGKIWTSKVVYNTLTGGQSLVSGTYSGTPSSLEIDNVSGTQTALGNISTGGSFNIDNGGTPTLFMNGFNLTVGSLNIPTVDAVLDMKTGVLSYAGLTDMEGKVRFSGATNGKAFATGIVDYYGTGQTVAIGAYNELLFSGVGGSYTIAGDLDIANTLTVTNGAVNVLGTSAVSVDDAVTVTAPGTLTFQNNTSLIQTTYTGLNSGNIIVKRNTTPLLSDDFTYWSSPTTSSQTLYDFSPNTLSDKFFICNNDWANVNAATTVFAKGIGYAIRASETTSTVTPTIDTSLQFLGVPNNGTINIPVTSILESGQPAGVRLIGNPYPSSIDADAFIDANITSGTGTQTITGTLYFWTHNHRISGNVYDGDVDYATYTKSGGIGVPSGNGNVITPTGDIASGEGFFVEVDVTGDLTFNNDMRTTATNSTNSNFYRQVATKKTNADGSEEKDRMWFNLTNATSGSQTLVGYIANTTNDYDPGYDGLVYNDTQPFAIYSTLGIDKLAIQGRALPFVDTDVVPLGYAVNVAGKTTISLDHVDGLFLGDQNIYLEDKVLNVVHDVKSMPYNFNSEIGTFNDRFVLRYTDKTLGTGSFESNDTSVLISKDKNELKIKSELENIKRVTVFDLIGRKVFDKEAVNSNEFRTSTITLNKQTVIVKVTLTNGQIISKKVLY